MWDSLIRNADAKEARAFLENIEALTIPYRYHRCILLGIVFPIFYPESRPKPF